MTSTSSSSSTELTRVAHEVAPLLAEHTEAVDREGRFPSEGLEVLRSTPLLGLLVPRVYGGAGGNLADLVRVATVLSAACTTTAFVWAMHCQQVDVLSNFAGPELAVRVLPNVAAGRKYIASITTEPAGDGRLLVAQAALAEVGDRLEFSRDAPIVTGGRHADSFLVTLRAHEQARAEQVTLLYVDRDELQLDEISSWDMLGMRGTENVGLSLRGCTSASNVVGSPGGFRTIAVESMIPAGHIAWSSCWIGAARAGLERLVRDLRQRRRSRADDFDLVAVRLARARAELELASAYLHVVANEVDQARTERRSLAAHEIQIHLNTLKVMASELSYRVANELIDAAGLKAGYTRGALGLERLLRDLRSASLNYPNDRLLAATGRLLFLDPAGTLAADAPRDRLRP